MLEDGKAKVRNFFLKMKNSLAYQVLLSNFLTDITPSLQLKVQAALFTSCLLANEVMSKFLQGMFDN